MPINYPTEVTHLIETVANGEGHSIPTLRQSVIAYAAGLSERHPPTVDLPPALQPFIEKVACHAYKTTDADIQQLKAANYSENEIFELTVSAALGAGLARLTQGLELLDRVGAKQD